MRGLQLLIGHGRSGRSVCRLCISLIIITVHRAQAPIGAAGLEVLVCDSDFGYSNSWDLRGHAGDAQFYPAIHQAIAIIKAGRR